MRSFLGDPSLFVFDSSPPFCMYSHTMPKVAIIVQTFIDLNISNTCYIADSLSVSLITGRGTCPDDAFKDFVLQVKLIPSVININRLRIGEMSLDAHATFNNAVGRQEIMPRRTVEIEVSEWRRIGRVLRAQAQYSL